MSDTEITELPAKQAHLLVPLLRQVHALHVAHMPDQYAPITDDGAVAAFLSDWLSRDEVTALITGPTDAPHGYLVYQIENRSASVLHPGACRAVLEHICVDAPMRGQGLGSALIRAMRSRLPEQGATWISTTYAVFNTASARLMAANGLAPQYHRARGPVTFDME